MYYQFWTEQTGFVKQQFNNNLSNNYRMEEQNFKYTSTIPYRHMLYKSKWRTIKLNFWRNHELCFNSALTLLNSLKCSFNVFQLISFYGIVLTWYIWAVLNWIIVFNRIIFQLNYHTMFMLCFSQWLFLCVCICINHFYKKLFS